MVKLKSCNHYLYLIQSILCSLSFRHSVDFAFQFNFVGKLLGPRGNSLKRLQEETGAKMSILGKGSMRDKAKVPSVFSCWAGSSWEPCFQYAGMAFTFSMRLVSGTTLLPILVSVSSVVPCLLLRAYFCVFFCTSLSKLLSYCCTF